jgi:hypothetical protein
MTEQKKIATLKPPKSTLPEELEKFELAMRQAKKAEQQAELFEGEPGSRDSQPAVGK